MSLIELGDRASFIGRTKTKTNITCWLQVRESEDFYSLSKDKLLELILSDELEIEDEQVRVLPLSFLFLITSALIKNINKNGPVCVFCRRLCLTPSCGGFSSTWRVGVIICQSYWGASGWHCCHQNVCWRWSPVKSWLWPTRGAGSSFINAHISVCFLEKTGQADTAWCFSKHQKQKGSSRSFCSSTSCNNSQKHSLLFFFLRFFLTISFYWKEILVFM